MNQKPSGESVGEVKKEELEYLMSECVGATKDSPPEMTGAVFQEVTEEKLTGSLLLKSTDGSQDCEDCQSSFTEQCEVHGPPVFIPDTPALVGVPGRALLTLPPGLEVRPSSIPGAGQGVFNQGQTVPRGVHFGPYEGEVTGKEEAIESSYSWVVRLSLQQ